jgi:hypothetical protein
MSRWIAGSAWMLLAVGCGPAKVQISDDDDPFLTDPFGTDGDVDDSPSDDDQEPTDDATDAAETDPSSTDVTETATDVDDSPTDDVGETDPPEETDAADPTDADPATDDSDAPAVTDAEPSDTDAGPPLDTAQPDAQVAPSILTFDIDDLGDELAVQLVAQDADGDLPGGTVIMTTNGDRHDYAIDQDLTDWTWVPGSGSGTAEFVQPYTRCTSWGTAVEVSLRVVDVAGHRSERVQHTLNVAGVGLTVPDVGDGFDSVYPLGSVTGDRAAICGDVHTVNIDGALADHDWTTFVPEVSGQWTVILTPHAGGDFQLDVNNELGFSVARDYKPGVGVPETLQVTLTAGSLYRVGVWGSQGSPGAWTVTLTGP